MKGTGDNKFAPKDTYTIEQAIVTLMRVYDNFNERGKNAAEIVTEDLSFADKLNIQMPKDKNYMFSPLSIKMALSLAANGADGTKTQTDFMNKTKWLQYAQTKSAQMIELPYKNRIDKISEDGEYLGSENYENLDVSMYVIAADGDINVADELNGAVSDNMFTRTYIKLSMPKFKIEFSASLNDMLMNIGITDAFKRDTAQFENMFDKGNMWISDTIHKTYISVDEKGTEAATVTAIGMGGTSLPPEPTELKFNKPFYFAIRDNTSGEILFMGRYAFAG